MLNNKKVLIDFSDWLQGALDEVILPILNENTEANKYTEITSLNNVRNKIALTSNNQSRENKWVKEVLQLMDTGRNPFSAQSNSFNEQITLRCNHKVAPVINVSPCLQITVVETGGD